MQRDSVTDTESSELQDLVQNSEYLRQQAHWIRDVLDPKIAVDGPDALAPDDALTLDELFRKLLESTIKFEGIRYSRMHLAISQITGKATRWPTKLVNRCDVLKYVWEAQFGSLKSLGLILYEPKGRLHGVCKPEDLDKERLLVKWLRSREANISPAIARKSGSLGFTPGESVWWISPLFAHRAGIIDSTSTEGGIVSDAKGAYAVVMTGDDEVSSSEPSMFEYRTRDRDPGRYRLTACTPQSKRPIRILRSHTLHSFWKPLAGLRYDGLHNVDGWSVKKDAQSKKTVFTVVFKRLATEVSMDTVLCRPWSNEIDDYLEYKRLRQIARENEAKVNKSTSTASIDGTVDSGAPETRSNSDGEYGAKMRCHGSLVESDPETPELEG